MTRWRSSCTVDCSAQCRSSSTTSTGPSRAAAVEDPGAQLVRLDRGMARQCRLADPGLARDEHDLASAHLGGREHGLQLSSLGLARCKPASRRSLDSRGQRQLKLVAIAVGPQDLVGVGGSAKALELERAHALKASGAAIAQREDGLADEHLT